MKADDRNQRPATVREKFRGGFDPMCAPFLCGALILLLMTASASRGADYQEPDLEPVPVHIRLDEIELTPEQRGEYAKALAGVARNFSELDGLTRAKAVCLAMLMDKTNKEAFIANFQLKRGQTPEPTEGYQTVDEVKATLIKGLKVLQEPKPGHGALASLLIDVLASAFPEDPEIAYELELMRSGLESRQFYTVWGPMLNVTASATVLPQPGNIPTSPSERNQTESPAMAVAVPEAPSTTMVPQGLPGNDGVKLARKQVLVKGLLVRPLGGNKFAGKASQMNATAIETGQSGEMEVGFNQEVGPDMSSALGEVLKFHRLRHDGLPAGYKVEISFEEQYVPKDGPSAAVACALMVESLIAGTELHPEFAVTGDMNADGSVQPVGGITGKIRGAENRNCKVILIPSANVSVISDILLMDGPEAITKIQIHTAETFEDALALASAERLPDIQKSIESFDEIQEVLLRPNGMRNLSHPKVLERLAEVIKLTPNNQSARLLLLAGQGRNPDRLSLRGSLDYIDEAAEPLLEAISEERFNERSGLDRNEFAESESAIRRLREKLDPRTVDCADAIMAYARRMKQFVENPPSSPTSLNKFVAEIRGLGRNVSGEFDKLNSRVDVQEELMR